VVGDLPFASYTTPEMALHNALRLIDAGANAVKLEGGEAFAPQVRAIVHAGIPVMGHIGMLPQSVKEEGGYKLKGKTEASRAQLLADAKSLEESGAFAIVLELVQTDTAALITQSIGIATIGIGSGTQCDGQILVTHDLIGSFPWFRPKFAKARANVAEEIKRAVGEFQTDVRGA
jgi:3-methyl-2-oxobutanoate hydroxymethyltransferase